MTAPGELEPSVYSDYKLPSGRHGIPAEEVAENQRWRLLGAAPEVLAECGYVRTTSVRIAKRAGVSSSTFYENFDNVAQCLLASFEAAAKCLLEVIADACDGAVEEGPRLGESIDASLAFLASEPALANLLITPAPTGHDTVAGARERLLDQLAGLLRSERPGPAGAPASSSDAGRHVIAGALCLVSERIAAGEAEALPDLTPDLVEIVRIAQLG